MYIILEVEKVRSKLGAVFAYFFFLQMLDIYNNKQWLEYPEKGSKKYKSLS